MKLIITGHDFSGKSTILKEIWKKENNDKMSYIHLSYREPTDYNFYNRTLDFSNFIMDRCFIDEIIYPEVFNRVPKLSYEGVKNLIDKCNREDINIIIFTCSNEEIKNRIIKRGTYEEPEVLNNIFKIKEKYKYIAEFFNIPLLDTTNKSIEEITEEVYSIIKSNNLKK